MQTVAWWLVHKPNHIWLRKTINTQMNALTKRAPQQQQHTKKESFQSFLIMLLFHIHTRTSFLNQRFYFADEMRFHISHKIWNDQAFLMRNSRNKLVIMVDSLGNVTVRWVWMKTNLEPFRGFAFNTKYNRQTRMCFNNGDAYFLPERTFGFVKN